MSFQRTLAPLYDRSAVISLTVSDSPYCLELRRRRGAAQDHFRGQRGRWQTPVAPGGLISVYGQQMARSTSPPMKSAAHALGESCLTVNGVAVPVLFVSSQQINGQLPFNVDGNAQMTLRTRRHQRQLQFSILSAAPSVFHTGAAGPETGLATVTRADNASL